MDKGILFKFSDKPFWIQHYHYEKEKLVDGFAYIQSILTKLAHLAFPTIAAINGICYSGAAELTLACDIRVVISPTYL